MLIVYLFAIFLQFIFVLDFFAANHSFINGEEEGAQGKSEGALFLVSSSQWASSTFTVGTLQDSEDPQ